MKKYLIVVALAFSNHLAAQSSLITQLEEARGHYFQQRYEEAIDLASEVAKAQISDSTLLANAFLLLGAANADIGSETLAMNSFDFALRLRPSLYYDFSFYSEAANRLFTNKQSELIKTIRIITSPSDAAVSINEKYIGNTPLVVPLLKDESCRINISKHRYHDRHFSFDLQNSPIPDTLKDNLVKKKGKIEILSSPPGVNVELNDAETCTTPCILDSMDFGDYIFKLVKKGFNPINCPISLDSTYYLINQTLPGATGYLSLRFYPPEAFIMIDKRVIKYKSPQIIELPVGPHLIRCDMTYNPRMNQPLVIQPQDTTLCFIYIPKNRAYIVAP